MGKASYEVHVRRDGRWSIEACFDDQESAERLARAEISAHGAEEVKVLKYRPFAGFEVEISVFHRKAAEVKEGAMMLGGGADGAPLCRDTADLYGFDARMVMARLLRVFLDKHQITVSELLHGWVYARRLDEQGNLLRAAIGAVVRWQGDALGADVKERSRVLTGLVETALARTRNFNAERKQLPPFDWGDLARTSRRLGYEAGEDQHDFTFLAQLTEALQGCGGLLAKQEKLLDPWEDCADSRVAGLLQGVVADTLASVEALRELLGPQPSLAASLATLGDLLLGRPPALDGAPVSPLLTRIGRMIGEGRAPDCRVMLLARLRASLEGEQPLDRRSPEQEGLLIGMLEQRLLGPDGRMLGGGDMARALTRRAVRHRQALLRGQGMHDVADAVGATARRER